MQKQVVHCVVSISRLSAGIADKRDIGGISSVKETVLLIVDHPVNGDSTLDSINGLCVCVSFFPVIFGLGVWDQDEQNSSRCCGEG